MNTFKLSQARRTIVTSLVSLGILLASISADARPVESLNDLPRVWNGVAGDLFTKSAARLVVTTIKTATVEETAYAVHRKYTVDGTFSVGTRVLELAEITLSTQKIDSATAPIPPSLMLSFNDPLVKVVYGAVIYRETENTFTFADYLEHGQRRFVLTGDAPRK